MCSHVRARRTPAYEESESWTALRVAEDTFGTILGYSFVMDAEIGAMATSATHIESDDIAQGWFELW